MFWKSIELHNYLPFSHSNIKKVDVSFEDPVTAFLGTNGSGKSSLLRALTPYPPTRTEFGPAGKIVKTLDHNGHIYELVSDFKNSAAPHMFLCDGVNLNLSGTTDTQKDLIEEHFGVTPMLDKIMAGEIKICTMSKVERKALFSSMYPSDLSFVLEYHKQVCSQSRACANQLKLLKSREATIRSSLMDGTEVNKLHAFVAGAEDIIKRIDKCIIILEEQNRKYREMYQSLPGPAMDYTAEQEKNLGKNIRDLGRDILWRVRHLKFIDSKVKINLADVHDLESRAKQRRMTIDVIKERISHLSAQIDDISSELARFNAYKEASTSVSEKNTLEERYKRCSEELMEVNSRLGGTTTAPLDISSIDRIESELLPMTMRWVESFHSISERVISSSELSELGIRLEHTRLVLRTEIDDTMSQIARELVEVEDRLTRLTSRSYPSECTMVCQLRSTVEESIKATQKRRSDLLDRRSRADKQAQELYAFVNDNSPVYDRQMRYHSEINRLTEWLRRYGVESIAFEGEDPVECCNFHCSDIPNRIIRACSLTRYIKQRDELSSELTSIQKTLEKMSETRQLQMSMELIESTIKDKESKINAGAEEMIDLENRLSRETSIAEEMEDVSALTRELNIRVSDAEQLLNMERIEMITDFHKDLINELESTKFELNQELFSVNETISNRQKYIDILESEIIPTTQKVEADKRLYDAIADGLSPSKGLPCIYLVRFINRLIMRANKIISHVWMYGMELVYLKEDDELDFNIQVRIRGNTTVKDLSTLSMGQQTIVNLAMTLALCIERGLLDWMALRLDEVDGPLTDEHRTRLVCMLSDLVDKDNIRQLFLVNHFAMQTGMSKCANVVLSSEGICVPDVYNSTATIE